uniref:RNA-polymerase II-associated protein 3-like C-terminal domain-containing protein n=1 Tax=Musa acuminata subsp. malaccensis TaxID=214687 RepID=A0A804HV89_MUSAM|nr:PREDICTED: RNA polymerase II-associated protein 3 isoform X1 [Musa acuminata subsp. malaccensis]
MAGVSRKPDRDRSMEFKGFLNDLKDWDDLLKDKDEKLKGHARRNKKPDSLQNPGIIDGYKEPPRKVPAVGVKPKSDVVFDFSSDDHSAPYDYSKYTDAIGQIYSSNLNDEALPDAASEKELGNEYFKQKRFLEAIECYSRSIALSPTSVAFANRAMAYLKLRRFEEAENDCTEALNLDDRYVKAYSRRATARKELGKLKASLEDADFAVRLDPNTQELRKQYSEIKALYEKEVANRKSGALKEASKESQRADGLQVESKIIQDDYLISNRVHNAAASSHKSSVVKNERVQHKHELKASLHDVASRAASRAVASAAKNITSPKSAYEFEVSWRALSDDSAQAQLLKMIPPYTLPQIFKNALSAPILVDIIKCIGTFFKEDTELAISLLDNMVKVPRFDMIIMCLSAKDHSEVQQVWEEIFSTRYIPVAHTEALARLRPKYCYREQQEKN